MEFSIFLAQLFGIYFIIAGLICLFRRGAIREMIVGFKNNRPLMFVIAWLEIVAGLAIALTHSFFTPDFRIVITIIAYWMIVEGLIYMLTPKKKFRKFMGYFAHASWVISGGVISVIFGAYLTAVGFGWWM